MALVRLLLGALVLAMLLAGCTAVVPMACNPDCTAVMSAPTTTWHRTVGSTGPYALRATFSSPQQQACKMTLDATTKVQPGGLGDIVWVNGTSLYWSVTTVGVLGARVGPLVVQPSHGGTFHLQDATMETAVGASLEVVLAFQDLSDLNVTLACPRGLVLTGVQEATAFWTFGEQGMTEGVDAYVFPVQVSVLDAHQYSALGPIRGLVGHLGQGIGRLQLSGPVQRSWSFDPAQTGLAGTSFAGPSGTYQMTEAAAGDFLVWGALIEFHDADDPSLHSR